MGSRSVLTAAGLYFIRSRTAIDIFTTVLSVLIDHQNIAQFRAGITHPIDIG